MSQAPRGVAPGRRVVPPGGAARAATAAPAAQHRDAKKFTITESVTQGRGKRVVVYGPGGVGKTSSAALAPGAVIIDLEQRTGHVAEKLLPYKESHGLALRRIEGIGVTNSVDPGQLIDPTQGFQDVRDALHNYDLWQPGMTAVIDSFTKMEEWSYHWIVANRKTSKGAVARSIEEYGWGEGFTMAHEEMVKVLQDLDILAMRGVNSIVICHDTVEKVVDPLVGEMKRYEPRLYRSASGKADTRLRVREWADYVLFYNYLMAKDAQGTVQGAGQRVIYTQERPGYMAKSSLDAQHQMVIYGSEFDDSIWRLIFPSAYPTT